ncbi:AAA family ATPase [Maritimibacter sp. DP1N21-5]|uniref:AAA family ATPase n=1 Tax=Maritimibacter sp. DP1N21-5 TaxID=2836867 RepID=UPI001C45A83F|nr:AAA family ATPase [Maritimibacter sp. DP1N21-5]MBV7408168.1 ATP-binding protein [Maritimibacter sp. DP1N21-5]
MQTGTIESIKVEKLFGHFDYEVPEGGTLKNPSILYGDNGVGKSTLLTLVFHLLSSAGDRGHRTAIYGTPFLSLSVRLKNGYTLKAEREDDAESPLLIFSIYEGARLHAEWKYRKGYRQPDYFADSDISDIVLDQLLNENEISASIAREIRLKRSKAPDDGVRRGEQQYLRALSECSPTIFLVSAERRLDSDAVSDPTEELELREIFHENRGRRVGDLVKRSRQIALKQALLKASRWVQQRALRSATQGSMNVHSVYEQILGQLATDYNNEDTPLQSSSISEIVDKLDTIAKDSTSYSRYEITGAIDVDRFRNALTSGPEQGRAISAKLIDPYVRSVLSRLEAIAPIYKKLDEFIRQINTFLTRKTLTFSMSKGFMIVSNAGEDLEASQLSSGEQQLLLMFCYALTAQDQPSVFIVDEPEISLNIKWQRQLLKSLNQVTQGTETQFIFASHSLELIAQHRDSVVEIG